MNNIERYDTGLGFIIFALALLYLGAPIWAILPEVAAVYVLGSLLYEQIFKG
jgi:hypothetical protein